MKEINAYGCDYCAMTSRSKSAVKRHEINSCRKNPNRKACNHCKNLDLDGDLEYGSYFCSETGDYIEHPLNINMNDCAFFKEKDCK